MQSVNCYDRCIINVSGKSTYISLSDLEQVTYNDEHLRKYNFFKIWNMPLKTSCVVYMPLRETFRIKWVCHEVVQVSVMEGHHLSTKWRQRVRGAVWFLGSSHLCWSLLCVTLQPWTRSAEKKQRDGQSCIWYTRWPLVVTSTSFKSVKRSSWISVSSK